MCLVTVRNVLLIVGLCFATVCNASNILFFHLAATSSHRTSIWPLAELLAEKGHNVTYIFPVEKRLGSHPNVEEITPSKMVPIMKENGAEFDINYRLNNTVDEFITNLFSVCFDLCRAFYDSPETIQWLNRPGLKYDLIMMDSTLGECGYGLVHKFQAKHIIFAPGIMPYIWDGLGVVPESSSLPSSVTMGQQTKPSEMNFFGRMKATLTHIVWRFGYLSYASKVEEIIKEKLKLEKLPPIPDFEKNTSLVLINSHIVDDYPMALPPMFVSYSGLWCSKRMIKKNGKSLPQEISSFLEGANDGFIYVSFGSAVDVSKMPASFRNHFIHAFSYFPNLKFLWRWTGKIPENLPENVLLKPWFPQHDILAHPKIKGFITQAGRPSIQEALCYGVPLIAIPIFGEQDYNADRMEYIGAAISLEIGKLSEDLLKEAIQNLAYTDGYQTKMFELSAMFRDRPLDPLENALFWVEYVLRHKNLSLLRPLGIHQTWYERRLLDIYLFLGVATGTLLALLAMVIIFSLKRCFGILTKNENKVKLKQS